jgi:hypothetical protein
LACALFFKVQNWTLMYLMLPINWSGRQYSMSPQRLITPHKCHGQFGR